MKNSEKTKKKNYEKRKKYKKLKEIVKKRKKSCEKRFGKCPFGNLFLGNVFQDLSVSVKNIFRKCPFGYKNFSF